VKLRRGILRRSCSVRSAVVGGAGAIVTSNLKHFPVSKVPRHIDVLPPAEFARDAVGIDPSRDLAAPQEICIRYRNPPATIDQLLAILESRYRMTRAVGLLRSAI
jgi:hypothetical protein